MKYVSSLYTILAFCLIAVVLFFFLIKEILRILTINRLRKDKDRSAKHVCDLLCERFPKSTVYRNVYLLKDDASESGLNNICDVVYISRGGVLLLTVLPDIGVYDNPKIGAWRYRYVNTQKETVTLQMANPFENMAFFASVVEKLLVSENVLNASVSRAVIFTSDLVDYTKDYPECLTVGTLYEYIEAFDRRAHFNKTEYRKVCEVIAACSEYLEGTSANGFAPIEKIRIPKAARTVPEKSGDASPSFFAPTPAPAFTSKSQVRFSTGSGRSAAPERENAKAFDFESGDEPDEPAQDDLTREEFAQDEQAREDYAQDAAFESDFVRKYDPAPANGREQTSEDAFAQETEAGEPAEDSAAEEPTDGQNGAEETDKEKTVSFFTES